MVNFSYMLLADYAEYVKAQERVDELFKVCFVIVLQSSDRLFFSLESKRMDEKMYFKHRRIWKILIGSND